MGGGGVFFFFFPFPNGWKSVPERVLDIGVRGAVFDRGAVIGTLYFGGPYFDNCLVLEQQYASSRNKKKIWRFSKYGTPKYRVPITTPLSKAASFTTYFCIINIPHSFL